MSFLELPILVYWMATLVLLHGIGSAIFFFWLSGKMRAKEGAIARAARSTGEMLQQLEQNLDRLRGVREKVPAFASAVSDLVTQLGDQVDRIDQQAERGVRAARERLAGGDRRLEAGLLQFERQTARVQKLVRHPAVRASALAKAGLAFLTELLRRPADRAPSPYAGDDEIFI